MLRYLIRTSPRFCRPARLAYLLLANNFHKPYRPPLQPSVVESHTPVIPVAAWVLATS